MTFKDESASFGMNEKDPKEEVIQAWYMDDSEEDQRRPHHCDPKKFVSLEKLAGYFDVRDENDGWICVAVKKGGMIVLPAGMYHRFTLDTNNYIKAMQLFVGDPVWTPYNRCHDHLPTRKEYVQTLGKKDGGESSCRSFLMVPLVIRQTCSEASRNYMLLLYCRLVSRSRKFNYITITKYIQQSTSVRNMQTSIIIY